MIKNIPLLFAIASHCLCLAMQLDNQRPVQIKQSIMDVATAKKVIEQLLEKNHKDIANSLAHLSLEEKECIHKVLSKHYPLFKPHVKIREVLAAHTTDIITVACGPDGRFALTGSADKKIVLWDLQTKTKTELTGLASWITSMAFSPNGRFALIGTDSTVTIFDLLDIKQIKGYQSQVQTGWVTAVAFSHDSNFALTGSSDETAQLWDLTAFPTMRSYPLQGHTGWVTAATFSPDGQHALTGSSDKTARLWDLSEFPITSRELTGHTGALRSVAFDPTGRYALTGSTDQTARLWDITRSAITSQELRGHTNWVNTVAFSYNGQHAITSSYDKTVLLWNLAQYPITSTSLANRKTVALVIISPDGRFIVTSSSDETALLCDLAPPITWYALGKLKGSVRSCAFSPNSMYAIVGSRAHSVQLLKIRSHIALPLDDSFLLLKLKTNPYCLKDDIPAHERLQLIVEKPGQHNEIIDLF